MTGVDLSNYQAGIDYAALKSANIQFAILKICEYNEDKSFQKHYAGLKSQGIPVGAYIYTHAKTPEAVRAEADKAIKILAGRALDLPLFLDMEADDINVSWKTSVLPVALAFGEYVSSRGMRWGIYANRSWWQNKLDVDAIRSAGGCVWCAAYNNTGAGIECDIWQYTDKGKIQGCANNLDMNMAYDVFREMWKTKLPAESQNSDETVESKSMCDVADGRTPESLHMAALLHNIGYDVLWLGLGPCITDYQAKVGLPRTGKGDRATWDALSKG